MCLCLRLFVPLLSLRLLPPQAVPYIRPANWLVFEPKTVDWGTYINVMFWWDAAAVHAAPWPQRLGWA